MSGVPSETRTAAVGLYPGRARLIC